MWGENLEELKKLVGEKIEAIYELNMENVDDILTTKTAFTSDRRRGYIETASGEQYFGDGDDYVLQTENNLFLLSIAGCSGDTCVGIERIAGQVIKHFVWKEKEDVKQDE